MVTILLPAVSRTSRDLVKGIAAYAAEQGDWHLVLHLWGQVREDDFRAIQQGDGVLFETLLPTSPISHPEWRIPAVGMQDPTLLDHGPVVSSDRVALGGIAAEYLVDKGLTHLAYVSYEKGNQTEQGFRQGAEAAGLELNVYYLHGEQPELDVNARHRVREWFEALPAPTGVLFRGDYLAYKLMDWLPAEWMPERLALLGIGNDPLICDIARPTLSSLDREGRSIGRRAAELLHRMMDGEEIERKLYLTPPGHVVERQTTGLDYTADPLVTRAVRFMQEHLEDTVSTDNICRRAKDLLRNGDKQLAFISDTCGFTSPQQFSKAFKESVGVTPRDYRQRV